MSTLTHFIKLWKYSFSDKYFWSRKQDEAERYLSTATDLYDLELKQKELQRKKGYYV